MLRIHLVCVACNPRLVGFPRCLCSAVIPDMIPMLVSAHVDPKVRLAAQNGYKVGKLIRIWQLQHTKF
jgi:hypothetical protein